MCAAVKHRWFPDFQVMLPLRIVLFFMLSAVKVHVPSLALQVALVLHKMEGAHARPCVVGPSAASGAPHGPVPLGVWV